MLGVGLLVLRCSYGVKTINGKNRLNGPGLDTSDVPGIISGGGKWPGRSGCVIMLYCCNQLLLNGLSKIANISYISTGAAYGAHTFVSCVILALKTSENRTATQVR